MLPLGKISKTCTCLGDRDRYTYFTPDEQRTMLTLWSLFRSPLILGGELRENRPEELEVITNRDILEINQLSSENRQLFRTRRDAAWYCRDKNGNSVVALFNLTDEEKEVSVDFAVCGIEGGAYNATELWTKEASVTEESGITAKVKAHGCAIFRLSK